MHYFCNEQALDLVEQSNSGTTLSNPREAILAGFAEVGRDANRHPHTFSLEREAILKLAQTRRIEIAESTSV